MTKHFALMSGGHDSLLSTYIGMEMGPSDEVLHLCTNTGIKENLEFIKVTCEVFGWDLRIEESPMTLEEFGKKYGFPGPPTHGWAYAYFKERQLERVYKEYDDLHFWTGVRMDESRRRMKHLSGGVIQQDRKERWLWHSPLTYLSKEKCEKMRRNYELPENPVVKNIHRSGECYCGAFATRDEELIDLMVHYPDQYEWLKSVEQEVLDERGIDDPLAYWGHGSISDRDVTVMKMEN